MSVPHAHSRTEPLARTACDAECVTDTRGDGICDDAWDCALADYDDGDCEGSGPGDPCLTVSGDVGVTDCAGACDPWVYWWGDGICDVGFDCAEMDFDDGDCPVPVGTACTTDTGEDGIFDCEGTVRKTRAATGPVTRRGTALQPDMTRGTARLPNPASPAPAAGDRRGSPAALEGAGLTPTLSVMVAAIDELDCASLDFDDGDCVSVLDACTLSDGSAGLIDCDKDCSPDTRGDGSCDAAWACAEAELDLGDCVPRTACTLEDGTPGVVDCDMSCALDTSEDDACDERFECFEFAYDSGACECPADLHGAVFDATVYFWFGCYDSGEEYSSFGDVRADCHDTTEVTVNLDETPSFSGSIECSSFSFGDPVVHFYGYVDDEGELTTEYEWDPRTARAHR